MSFNTSRRSQNGRHFADDIFKGIFLNENIWIPIKISLKFVPKGPVDNIPAWVQIMAWRRSGDKPLYEPMMVCSLTHICVTRPQYRWDSFCHYNNIVKKQFRLNMLNAELTSKMNGYICMGLKPVIFTWFDNKVTQFTMRDIKRTDREYR